jgi:hypothetical protein
MLRISNTKPCTSCGKTTPNKEYNKYNTECIRCHLLGTKRIPQKDKSNLIIESSSSGNFTGNSSGEDTENSSDVDDVQHKYKKLKKRVEKLEDIVVELSERLHDQEKRTIGIEGIMDGFALGIGAKRNVNKNIVEI